MVTVNLTDRCNQRCIYCEIGSGNWQPAKDVLTKDDLFWIIDEMHKEGIPKISLCGGEPFLFVNIIDVLAYAGEKDIRTSITTNGMTVHDLHERDLIILQKYRAEVNISLDSFNHEINSFTRGTENALPNALKSIQKLLRVDIPVTVLVTISKYNCHELIHTLTRAYDIGVRQMLFQPVIYFSNYPGIAAVEQKAQLNVGLDQLAGLMDQLRSILKFESNHRIHTNVYRILPWISHYLMKAAGRNGTWFFDEVLDRFYCREVYAIIDITFDGGIQPCGLRPASVSIRNDRKAGLMALWHKATEDIRACLENGNYFPECNGCCHHFSRNMLASMLKFPWRNRNAWIHMTPLLLSRAWFRLRRLRMII